MPHKFFTNTFIYKFKIYDFFRKKSQHGICLIDVSCMGFRIKSNSQRGISHKKALLEFNISVCVYFQFLHHLPIKMVSINFQKWMVFVLGLILAIPKSASARECFKINLLCSTKIYNSSKFAIFQSFSVSFSKINQVFVSKYGIVHGSLISFFITGIRSIVLLLVLYNVEKSMEKLVLVLKIYQSNYHSKTKMRNYGY